MTKQKLLSIDDYINPDYDVIQTLRMNMIQNESQSTSEYENPWIFNGQIFKSSDISNYYGFVYCIVNKTNGKKYIGRKYFYSKRKGERKKESDWKKYYGSSDKLKADIAELGQTYFERHILSLHETKGSVNYTEIEEQFLRRVIQDDNYYNISIAGKYANVNLTESYYNTKLHCDCWCEIHSKFMTIYNNSHRWINDGKKNKKISKDDVLPDGWVEGKFVSNEAKKKQSEKIKTRWIQGKYDERVQPPRSMSDETKERLREANLGDKNPRFGKKNSAEHIEAIATSTRGKIWITNDRENKRIDWSELDNYLSRGFRRGHNQRINKLSCPNNPLNNIEGTLVQEECSK